MVAPILDPCFSESYVDNGVSNLCSAASQLFLFLKFSLWYVSLLGRVPYSKRIHWNQPARSCSRRGRKRRIVFLSYRSEPTKATWICKYVARTASDTDDRNFSWASASQGEWMDENSIPADKLTIAAECATRKICGSTGPSPKDVREWLRRHTTEISVAPLLVNASAWMKFSFLLASLP
jgi:hypothetical protein